MAFDLALFGIPFNRKSSTLVVCDLLNRGQHGMLLRGCLASGRASGYNTQSYLFLEA